MKNLLFVVIVGLGGIFLARQFLSKKDENAVTQLEKILAEKQRIHNVGTAVVNNAAPAVSTIGNLPDRTTTLIPIFTGGFEAGRQAAQVPLSVNQI